MRRLVLACALLSACGGDDGGGSTTDAGGTADTGGSMDTGTGTDAGTGTDTGTETDAGTETDTGTGTDAGPPIDSGPVCMGMATGSCDSTPGTMCLCCPAGGPAERCLCTTRCAADSECTDPSRPRCNQPTMGGGIEPPGICTPTEFVCAWGAVCASPDTPVATPDGERAIASLAPGDLVYSVDRGALVVVPILRVSSTPVTGHRVVRVELATGRVVEMSEGHPTAEGRTFRDLAPGERLGGVAIRSLTLVPYAHDATYDILPASDTGAYVASGALVGSTLR